MRLGITISALLHAAVLAWALIGMRSVREFDKPAIIPIALDIVSEAELNQMRKGDTKAPNKEPEPAKENEKAGKETPKPKQKVAAAPPPPPAAPPEPPDQKPDPAPTPTSKLLEELKKSQPPEPEPPKPEVKAEPPPPKPEPEPQKAPEKPDDILNAMKASEPPKPQPKPEPPKPEVKPEPPKKAAEPKPRPKPRPKPQPKQVASAQDNPPAPKSTFDAAQIKALLDKTPDKSAPPPSSAPETPSAAPPRAVLGAPTGRDRQISGSELAALVYAIRSQVQPCWNLLGGAVEADKIVVRMRVRFNRDGTIVGQPQVMDAQGTPFFQIAADRAVGAVMQCQPYNLPGDKYEFWQDVILKFDPREMF